MNRTRTTEITLAVAGLAALVAVPAGAGYRDLKDEQVRYEPPALYRSTLDAREAPTASTPESAAAADDFERQVAEFRKMKAEGLAALARGAEEDPFYLPDPARFEALDPAAKDPKAAADAVAQGFVLEDLVVLALLRNPGVKAAEHEFRAAFERYDQASNLDEILRQYTAFTEALMTGIGPMKGKEPIETKFPFPGVLALKGQIVGQEIRTARESLEIARRTAATEARKLYWELLFVHRARETTDEMVRLLRHLEAVATTRYEAGAASFQDAIKVRIERETREEELRTLSEQQANMEAMVRELLALSHGTAVGAPLARDPDRTVPDLVPLYELALQKKQELGRLRARIGKMERMIEMAETRIQPTFSPGFSYYQDEAVTQVGTAAVKDAFGTTTAASAGVGLPKMPWYGTNDAYVRETREKLKALREELEKAENQAVLAVRNAWFHLDRAAREEALYAESIVDLSQAALEVSTRAYETGRIPFADGIQSYTTWLNANLALARKRSDLGVARANLEAAVGVSPIGG